MPVHDWSHVPAGLFHHFHQFWSVQICARLNDGVLPAGYYALVEQHAIGLAPDVLALETRRTTSPEPELRGGLAVADAPPRTRFILEAEEDGYVAQANRVSVRTAGGTIVAIIEIVSPGNKSSRAALRDFVTKAVEFLRAGVNLLVVDILPPGPRDLQGLHKEIWDEILERPFELPAAKRLTLAAYTAGPPRKAYVEPVGVGDELPGMPIFLDAQRYVPVPLELSYEEAWRLCPREFREAVLASAGV